MHSAMSFEQPNERRGTWPRPARLLAVPGLAVPGLVVPVLAVLAVPGLAVLGLAVLGLAAACADDVAGTPKGAAGFEPAATPSSSQASSPGAGAPQRRPEGVDTCTLLTSADLDPLGGTDGAPQRDALLPESCAYDLAGGAGGDVAAVAFYQPLDRARAQASGGTLVDTDGYSTWLACQVDEGYQSCSAAVAVHPDRTLLVLLSRRDVSDAAVRADLETLTHTALTRLPPA
ncbi:MAG: DUF3558 family protein [Pseudonocardiaceae bacterium]